MDNKQIEQQIKSFEDQRETLKHEKIELLKNWNILNDELALSYRIFKQDLIRAYYDTAVYLAHNKYDTGPYNSYGERRDPDTVDIKSEGFFMFWDADHPYDRQNLTIPWKELIEEYEENSLA